jgi:hypothetical protein
MSEQQTDYAFKQLGLYEFFDIDEDSGVDWEEHFGLLPKDGGRTMQALRVTQDVAEDGYLHIAVPPGMSRRCEIIVLSLEERQETRTFHTAKMQEQSGFVQKVLGAASEDVWNDL